MDDGEEFQEHVHTYCGTFGDLTNSKFSHIRTYITIFILISPPTAGPEHVVRKQWGS